MNAEKLTEKQRMTLWFVRLRWGAILLIMFVCFVSIYPGNLRIPFLAILLLLGIASTYNALYPALIRRFPFFSENATFTFARVSVDLIMITAVIHFTGGVESTLAPLYLLDLIAISIFGFERIAYLLSFEAGIFFLINSLLERFLIIKHYQLTFMPSSLYLNSSYAVSKAMGLFFASLLSIYIVSFLLQRMRDKQKQIEVLSKGQLDFMNAVMHEVKSPLTSIMGYAEMLSEQKLGPLSDPQKEPVEVINRQSRRILDMINDLLDLARIESGVFKLDKKPLSLIEVACKVIEEMEPSLDARKLVLVQEFDPAVPAVNVDEGKITEVFTNLLSNAAKFSNIGGKIFFSIAPQGTEVLVSIRDEGLGINPVDLPHIFEKFYRASKESMERKGTGLGLAICKTIIESHGGKIWAVSAGFGQGAVFYFTLPL